jgi:hypothetical protein
MWSLFCSYIAENFQLFLSDEKLKKRLLTEVDVDKENIVIFGQYFRQINIPGGADLKAAKIAIAMVVFYRVQTHLFR